MSVHVSDYMKKELLKGGKKSWLEARPSKMPLAKAWLKGTITIEIKEIKDNTVTLVLTMTTPSRKKLIQFGWGWTGDTADFSVRPGETVSLTGIEFRSEIELR